MVSSIINSKYTDDIIIGEIKAKVATYNNEILKLKDIPLVLQLDVAGNPHVWINFEKAAYYHTKSLVAWSIQSNVLTLYGGTSRITGKQSRLNLDTIIAIKGKVNSKQLVKMHRVPLSNKTLFRRDQNICAYCGRELFSSDLSRDHIIPVSKGGLNNWMNVVCSCHHCNKVKNNRTPEKANMPLLYCPYIPNRAEWLILHNRKILSDQMDFLLRKVPTESRLIF